MARNDKEVALRCERARVVAEDRDRLLEHAWHMQGILRACLYLYTSDPADVDALMRATFERLMVATDGGDVQISSPRVFCLNAVRSVALDWLRTRENVSAECLADIEAIGQLEERAQIEEIVRREAVSRRQELEGLVSAIEQLPLQSQRVFVLRKVYGFNHQQIAERLQISKTAVAEELMKSLFACARVSPSRSASGDGREDASS